jgi:hypothetical protein
MGGKLLLLVGAFGFYLTQLVGTGESQPLTGGFSYSSVDSVKIDSASGLIVGEHLDIVIAQCATVCHSSQTIRVNRFTREGWKGKIRWMQANHNLWELGETEKMILDYLEMHYAPGEIRSRRKPLKDFQWYRLKKEG